MREDRSASFVELFFDLVFVFAITELTKLAASDLTWSGAGRSVLVAWLIWWAWSQFTWALNPADTDHGIVRGATLFAGALAFLMAISVGADVG
jgi:low temperature requirement protein LtrA